MKASFVIHRARKRGVKIPASLLHGVTSVKNGHRFSGGSEP